MKHYCKMPNLEQNEILFYEFLVNTVSFGGVTVVVTLTSWNGLPACAVNFDLRWVYECT